LFATQIDLNDYFEENLSFVDSHSNKVGNDDIELNVTTDSDVENSVKSFEEYFDEWEIEVYGVGQWNSNVVENGDGEDEWMNNFDDMSLMQKTVEDSGEIGVSDIDFGDNCVLEEVEDDGKIEVSEN
jgi:hypothetical protein